VQGVEKILEEKEQRILELQDESKSLNNSLDRVNGEKELLIDAIYQKDLVIREYETRL
jgi:hypothetical protein